MISMLHIQHFGRRFLHASGWGPDSQLLSEVSRVRLALSVDDTGSDRAFAHLQSSGWVAGVDEYCAMIAILGLHASDIAGQSTAHVSE